MKNRRFFLMLAAGVILAGAGTAFGADTRQARNLYAMYELERTDCLNNLTAFYNALKNYAAKNNGMLPPGNNFEGLRLLGGHGVGYEQFVCRGGKARKARDNSDLSEEKNPFFYFGGMNLDAAVKASRHVPLLADKADSRHLNVLFVDGRIDSLRATEIKRKISNCRELVDFLNEKYKYPPEVLEMLRLKAGAIDNAK